MERTILTARRRSQRRKQPETPAPGPSSSSTPKTRVALKQFALPDLAIELILSNLNVYTLKQLRLVSREFKEWVEDGILLQKFKIGIKNDHDLRRWLHSSVPWNNFVFANRFPESFVTRFGTHLKRLTVEHTAIHIEFLLSGLSSNIEIINFGEVALYMDEEPNQEIRRKWRQNLVNLKELSIGGIFHLDALPFDISKLEKKSFIFDVILNSCSQNLTLLKLPWRLNMRMESQSDVGETHQLPEYETEINKEQREKLLRKFVLEPLFTFLRRFSENSSKLVIKFGPSAGVFAEFLISKNDLLALAHDCGRTGARLVNIPISVLPTDWVTADQRVLATSILSVTAFNSEHLNAFVPPTSKLKFIIGHSSHFATGELPSPIHSLFLDGFVLDVNPALFQRQRPTMKKLTFAGFKQDANDTSVANDICHNFPNLLKLEFYLWGHNADYTVVLGGLPLLTHLKLNNCMNLTDLGIIGPNPENPLIAQLTHLIYLEMSRTDITNASFTLAFRHMKLRTFKWTNQSSANVTFNGGISTLATIDGGFKDSVEILEISRPDNTPKAMLKTFVTTSFPNIQYFRIHAT